MSLAPALIKFSSSVPDQVFNGVFYNLDAQIENEF